MIENNGTPSDPVLSASARSRAAAIWVQYRNNHDPSDYEGKSVGVDPDTGEVFVATSTRELFDRLENEGRSRPLFFVQKSIVDAATPVKRMGWSQWRRVK